MKEFYSKLAEILEVHEIRSEDILYEFDEWDSLGVLSVISMVDEDYGVILKNEELKDIETVRELEDLIIGKNGIDTKMDEIRR